MNILIDPLPTEYKGYKINTDFRVGIRLCNILDDSRKSEEDVMDDAIDLLWGSGVPTTVTDEGIVIDYDLITETILWFRLGGDPEGEIAKAKRQPKKPASELSEDIAYDFDEDAGYIYAAFLQQYGIDLTTTEMHWFKFLALFKALQDTVFNRLQEIRTQDPLEVSAGKERARVVRMKQQYRILKVTPQREAELRAVYGDEWEEHI